jgi:hypothetical protein
MRVPRNLAKLRRGGQAIGLGISPIDVVGAQPKCHDFGSVQSCGAAAGRRFRHAKARRFETELIL